MTAKVSAEEAKRVSERRAAESAAAWERLPKPGAVRGLEAPTLWYARRLARAIVLAAQKQAEWINAARLSAQRKKR